MALSAAHVPPTNVFRRLTGSVNKTIVSMRKIAWKYVHNFFRYLAEIKKNSVWILFQDPNSDPDPAQNLINLSRSPRLSSHKISRWNAKIRCKSGSWIRTIIRIQLKT